ncbi:hypothetical protein A6M27_15700 [Acidithiobacillus thiooxidans]|uniref:Helix-turn-helix domain-containing protein n=1 Tax=Acidithiobacillus thiooxidans TaxID=930 RepID=A0A1C2J1F1_ACITH|nr:hypothetical protein A6P07_13605 [Acidithiobacillus thiooxidans]OCX70922.1 hypothetical protein A6M23_13160 [Acidithiobacillus thiooxidans]OCX72442.1 hypothetical protein A6O24_14000 [Acidithiobacillus thiooxidans]OCX82042.1 hypothetical protein A6O26_11215 [Acidithiobacillus thiooxidans]OCX84442.1 hypothetical protein A6P08_09010 [Acidithiobacillus thiooxidans]
MTSQLGRNEGFPHQQLLNEADAALILQVKPSTLQNWRCTGRYDLPFVKTGRLVRYRVADIAAWIAKRRQLG